METKPWDQQYRPDPGRTGVVIKVSGKVFSWTLADKDVISLQAHLADPKKRWVIFTDGPEELWVKVKDFRRIRYVPGQD